VMPLSFTYSPTTYSPKQGVGSRYLCKSESLFNVLLDGLKKHSKVNTYYPTPIMIGLGSCMCITRPGN
jgi:hypothetical protein